MAALVPAGEARRDVVLALEGRGAHAAGRVELHRVDELDVGRTAPGRHQPVERRAAVLVAEHDRVAQLAARLGRRMALDPGDERDVGEARERVLSRVEDRRVGERFVGRLPLGDGLDRDALDERLPCAAGRELAVEREREPVLSRRERAEQNAVLAALAARQHEVLVKRAVHRQGKHGRLAARRAPVAARARRAHHRHDLGRPLQPERRARGARAPRPAS